jgi:hypothetical protein
MKNCFSSIRIEKNRNLLNFKFLRFNIPVSFAVLAVFSWQSSPGSLFFLSCSGWPFLVFLFWQSCAGCPFLAVMFSMTCPGSPVLSFLSRLSFTGSPVLAVLFWVSFPSCPIKAVMSLLSCPGSCLGYPVLAVLSQLSWFYCEFPCRKSTRIPLAEELLEIIRSWWRFAEGSRIAEVSRS